MVGQPGRAAGADDVDGAQSAQVGPGGAQEVAQFEVVEAAARAQGHHQVDGVGGGWRERRGLGGVVLGQERTVAGGALAGGPLGVAAQEGVGRGHERPQRVAIGAGHDLGPDGLIACAGGLRGRGRSGAWRGRRRRWRRAPVEHGGAVLVGRDGLDSVADDAVRLVAVHPGREFSQGHAPGQVLPQAAVVDVGEGRQHGPQTPLQYISRPWYTTEFGSTQ
jgi:hypothetical protein